MEEVYSTFGKRLRKARMAVKLSQADVAERCGLSRPSLTNIERGEQRVALHQAIELAKAVRCELTLLISDADPMALNDEGASEPLEVSMLRGIGVDDLELLDWARKAVRSQVEEDD